MLCIWTPSILSASFWLSKSTWKIASFANFGWAVSSDRIGFCALQVGHQGAVTSTRIGSPAFLAASKAAGVKVLTSAACAVAIGESMGKADRCRKGNGERKKGGTSVHERTPDRVQP